MRLLDERGRALANRLLRNTDVLQKICEDAETSPQARRELTGAVWLLAELACTLEYALAFPDSELSAELSVDGWAEAVEEETR